VRHARITNGVIVSFSAYEIPPLAPVTSQVNPLFKVQFDTYLVLFSSRYSNCRLNFKENSENFHHCKEFWRC
jgi:hypothetical protein